MIHELRITGLGVIAEATCRFAPGFTAVTGETGAGKTMVVSGLGLLTGGRADAGLIRVGEPQAAVEGWFDAPEGPVAAIVTDAGGVLDDDGLTAARIIATRGRSVLGGRGVPTAVLADVVGQLLVIHGQHDQTRIGARALALLDAYAGEATQDLARRVGQLHGQLRSLDRELAELRATERERARELDLLEFSLAEIAGIDPQPDEDVLLAAEADRLANAEDLVGAAHTAREAITSDADLDGVSDVMGLLSAARRALESAAAHDPALAAPAAAIRSAMAQLGDVAADLSRVRTGHRRRPAPAGRDPGPARGPRTADPQVRVEHRRGAPVVGHLGCPGGTARRGGRPDRGARGTVPGPAGPSRWAVRRAQRRPPIAAQRFADEVATELAALAMPRARVAFTVTTTPDPDGLVLPAVGGDRGDASSGDAPTGPVAFRATGVDDVALMLAANPGAPLRPIAQAASGGELSRVMLAVQVVLAGADPVPTMVFDEVDAGVGGAAAIEVGRRLQQLSTRTQVIVVTHLAQVAAFADRQLVVTKDSDGSVTESSVQVVEGEQRVRELSRMLAGLADSEAAGAHASELLELAHSASRRG